MPQPRPQNSRDKVDNKSITDNDHHSDTETSILTDPPNQPILTFYPAYCHRASPTWFTWVKLTAWDIHNVLRARTEIITSASTRNTSHYANAYSSSSKPLVLYYLNHPIQYIQICGVVVSIEAYYETHFLFTLDDSSGCTIDVFYRKPQSPPQVPRPSTQSASTHPVVSTTKPLLLQHLDSLTIGTVVRAKGHLSTFHSIHQLVLLRLDIFPVQTATTLELAHITSRTHFVQSTLMNPWFVSSEDQTRLLREAQGESDEQRHREKRRKKRDAKRLEREEEDRKKIEDEYGEEEKVRVRYADEAKWDGERVMKMYTGKEE